MSKLELLKAKLAEIVAEMRAILDGADSEERSISDEEETRYNALETEMETVEADIKKAEEEEERRA